MHIADAGQGRTASAVYLEGLELVANLFQQAAVLVLPGWDRVCGAENTPRGSPRRTRHWSHKAPHAKPAGKKRRKPHNNNLLLLDQLGKVLEVALLARAGIMQRDI